MGARGEDPNPRAGRDTIGLGLSVGVLVCSATHSAVKCRLGIALREEESSAVPWFSFLPSSHHSGPPVCTDAAGMLPSHFLSASKVDETGAT